ncbi:hypothetical protein E2986_12650 [Frieseomelitta varia]|uniref:Uncharacterized protein n=1 Tax=Frieseomelitta varia TaxID=561572 RepID=A0A833W7R8_9HYME|nr:hypothetical protein E2986_12650 [Frieseomelitta varia]
MDTATVIMVSLAPSIRSVKSQPSDTPFATRGVKSVEVRIDDEEDVQYVHMEDPSATEITFVRAPCPSKEVMYVRCSELECGVQSLHAKSSSRGLNKMAEPGDWPWHVALFKEEVHE